jgi:hypothetical protein
MAEDAIIVVGYAEFHLKKWELQIYFTTMWTLKQSKRQTGLAQSPVIAFNNAPSAVPSAGVLQ